MASSSDTAITELLGSLVLRLFTSQSQASSQQSRPSEEYLERITRRSLRLLDSSLGTAPSLNQQDALVRSLIARLMREERHTDATRLAQLAAALKFDPAMSHRGAWAMTYLLAALMSPSSSASAVDISTSSSDPERVGGNSPNRVVSKLTRNAAPPTLLERKADAALESAFQVPRSNAVVETSSNESDYQTSEAYSSDNEDVFDSDGDLVHAVGRNGERQLPRLRPSSTSAQNPAEDLRSSARIGETHSDSRAVEISCKTSHTTEAMLVRDLTLIVQGESGTFLRFSALDDDASEKGESDSSSLQRSVLPEAQSAAEHVEGASRDIRSPLARLSRGEFEQVCVRFEHPQGEKLALSSSTIHTVRYISELGFLYNVIQRRLCSADECPGLVSMSFCNAVEHEMEDYYRSLASFPTASNVDDEHLPSLRAFYVWCEGEKPKLRWLARLCDETSSLLGGQILSHLLSYRRSYVSDEIRAMLSRLIARTAAPLNLMLVRWITEGVLTDPFDEFYIMEDPKVVAAARATAIATGGSEAIDKYRMGSLSGASSASNRIWWGLFKIRREMIPGFQRLSVVENALIAGKSVALLRRCFLDSAWVDQEHAPAISKFLSELVSHDGMQSNANRLESGMNYAVGSGLLDHDARMGNDHVAQLVDVAFRSASQRLKDLFFTKFDLSHHFAAVKNYLLLSQGDFTQALMESLAPILDGDGRILRNNITGLLDAAVRGSSSFNPKTDGDIAERLDVQILPQSADDAVGWDVFSLTYRVEDAPLNTVFSAKVMESYLQIFRFLWRLKRMEYALSSAYVELRQVDRQLWCQRRLSSTSMSRSPGSRKWDYLGSVENSRFSSLIDHALYIRMKMAHVVQNLQHYCMFEVLEGHWKILLEEMSRAGTIDALIRAHTRYLGTILDRALLSERGRKLGLTLNAVLDTVLQFRSLQEKICTWNGEGRSTSLDDIAVEEYWRRLGEVDSTFGMRFAHFLDGLKLHADKVESFMFLFFRLDYNSYYAALEESQSSADDKSRDGSDSSAIRL